MNASPLEMATNAFITSLNCIATKSIIYVQNGMDYERRRNLNFTSWFTKPSDLISNQGYTWQSRNFNYGRIQTPLKAISGHNQSDEENDEQNDSPSNKESDDANADQVRKRLERIVGDDNDAKFGGKDLATLIRNKYGRSYDVQLIKKEFMGKQLLAMNVMWKYREQRSFPLTEEEYLLRLDDVANNLKCWGAVSYIRNSLAKTKERPRIGKAVSIFIDLDETGGRANEWIYR